MSLAHGSAAPDSGGNLSSHERNLSQGRPSRPSSPPRETTPSASSGWLALRYSFDRHLRLADILERGRRLVLEPRERQLALVLKVSLPQEVAEEVVVAIRALLAGGEREHAVRREMREVAVRRVRAGEPVGELGADALEAARALEEGARGLVFAPVHLLREVRVDVLLEAGVGRGPARASRGRATRAARPASTMLAGQPSVSATRRSTCSRRGWRPVRAASTATAWSASNRRVSALDRGDVAGEPHLVHRERGIVAREHEETQARGRLASR